MLFCAIHLHILHINVKNGVLILTIFYCHIDFSNEHECILTTIYRAVFVLLLMHVLFWLSLFALLYIVRNDENKGDQSYIILDILLWYVLVCLDKYNPLFVIVAVAVDLSCSDVIISLNKGQILFVLEIIFVWNLTEKYAHNSRLLSIYIDRFTHILSIHAIRKRQQNKAQQNLIHI